MNRMEEQIEALLESYKEDSGTNFIDDTDLPVNETIKELIGALLELLFPGYMGRRVVTKQNVRYVIGDLLCSTYKQLHDQVLRAFRHECRIGACTRCICESKAQEACGRLFDDLVSIRKALRSDVLAAYEGDPAAKSYEEIVIAYPGITAISIHRIAHHLYTNEVPLIPRIMAEIAHARTGIDIHPGAEIGDSFFIDHGTGVVIGETTIIGNHVRLYQGVTLGSANFPVDDEGHIIRGKKRHPTIEDDVTIYAEATILGDVTIGSGSVIGGNVWVMEDVPPNTRVSSGKPEINFKPAAPHPRIY
ncbi:Serine O-acetyltransferase [Sediminispirochaeta smaragdinae DSM 11293]|uniref:serine O-acetyltransferase n=2 Tax=Sediminispirochaeta TaxID=1911556 RepID=E1R646_SEDSS|nr:Serine O-acetyltransferase [Sediminispirochaeta smaragdinae DSM 11293]